MRNADLPGGWSLSRPSRPFMEFTYKGARAAVHGRAFGAGRLVEWRMRRACSPFEAWGAWPRSRFAARSANCLKVAQRRGGAGARKKNCSVWQGACANGCHKFISRIWWRLLHETDDDRLMKMQARYTGSLKAARPPLSTTPYRRPAQPHAAHTSCAQGSGHSARSQGQCTVTVVSARNSEPRIIERGSTFNDNVS